MIDAIKSLNGPADGWALPYWNYSDTTSAEAGRIPPVFLTPTMPDNSANPLRVPARFGTGVPRDDADLTDRIADNDFIGIDEAPADGVGGQVRSSRHMAHRRV